MSFHVGQKIVCIEDDWTHPLVHLIPAIPRKGAVYHVRAFDPTSPPDRAFIWLVEIKNPSIQEYAEPAWAADGFRPIVERKTDISIFTAMLRPKTKELEPT